VFLGGALGTSLGGSFLIPRITYFDKLAREAPKRETGGIESEGYLRRWIQVSGSETEIPEFSGFHLNSLLPTFCLNVTFLCNYVGIHVLDVHRNSFVLLFRASRALPVEFRSLYGF